LDDSIIHATVVRQDQPTEDQSSIYVIFERLNTGGLNLQPQEIRVALYHGRFVGVLRQLNDQPAWRRLYGAKSRRLKDLEMILRFFAFFFREKSYRSPMKDFLNRYMASNRDLKLQGEVQLVSTFEPVTNIIMESIGEAAFRPVRTINAAIIDSVLVGTAKRLARGPITNKKQFRKCYEELLRNADYRSAVESGTSQEGNVSTRIRLAIQAFDKVK
jgi:hypothetical protein